MTNESSGAVPMPEMMGGQGPVLSLQSVYLKDCSYEAPNGPRVEGGWSPQINLDLQTAASQTSGEAREVVLTVTVSAKQNDTTIFLVEVKEADLKRAVSTVCPAVLFPYARSAVSQLVSQGGFPQFLLPPVNFDALYAANQTQPQGATN
jgi:preprotein translocase subunit SecB